MWDRRAGAGGWALGCSAASAHGATDGARHGTRHSATADAIDERRGTTGKSRVTFMVIADEVCWM